MAIMAFVGAGTASATALCKANETTCTAGNTYAIGTSIHAVLEPGQIAHLEAGPVNDECEESTMQGKSTKAGTPIIGTIEQLTFAKCSCTTSNAIHLPYKSEGAAGAGGNGTLTASTSGAGKPGGTVTCAGVHCVYETASAAVSVTGGTPATAAANVEMALNTGESDFLCLFTGAAHWKANYNVTSPSPLFITK
jgi:hypothetical protein